ncbi:hypothetical protein GN956_G20928 [Arapaima gigas]
MIAETLTAVGLLLSAVSSDPGEEKTQYCRVGQTVTLQCEDVPNMRCSSATWLYNRPGSAETTAVYEHGKIKDREMNHRLSVNSDCSLHISDVRAKDRGGYTCRKFVNGSPYGRDTVVQLNVFSEPDVTPDDPQTTTPRRDDVGGDQGGNHNDKKTTGPVNSSFRKVNS